MARLRFEDVHKQWRAGPHALRGLTLEIGDGELLVLVGPSGCGKSTALRVAAGLEAPTRGRVWIGDRDVTALAPRERDVAMVFQSYALYPHLSVRENLAFPLRMRRASREETQLRIAWAADVLGLADLLDRRPAALSGGQRQRVALGRALVREPQAFLLDEPLSNLDAKLRTETRAELKRLHRRLGATMLYVTHDQEEAMTLGDRLAVLRDGTLQQVGDALGVYRRPANRFVAEFIGSPAMNLLDARIVREPSGVRAEGAGFATPLPSILATAVLPEQGVLGVRPQDATLAPEGEGEAQARVEVVEPLGSTVLVHAVLESRGEAKPRRVAVLAAADARPETGARVGLRFPAPHLHLFDSETGARLG